MSKNNEMPNNIRILTIDIETAPNLAHVWGLWDQNVGLNQIEQVGSVMCFAAKWHDEKKVMFYSDHHDGHDVMIKKAWELMDEADIVVGYNSRPFDNKHLHREFLLAGLNPPNHYANVDLLAVVRKEFKFASNKLDFVAQQLGLGGKTTHDGFGLWKGCMEGSASSWRLMKKYNEQDVLLTERLYDRLLPWIKNHPNRNLYTGDETGTCCGRCGHDKLVKRGSKYYATASAFFQTLQCKKCGGYMKGERVRKVAGKNI